MHGFGTLYDKNREMIYRGFFMNDQPFKFGLIKEKSYYYLGEFRNNDGFQKSGLGRIYDI